MLLAALTGCSGSKGYDYDATTLPQRLEIELYMHNERGQAAYFELDRDGTLTFAGGKNAKRRWGDPVGTLDDEQKRALWQTIVRYDLMNARGQWFARGKQVRYECKLRAGGRVNSVNTGDDKVPGLDKLYEKLNSIRVDFQYGRVIDPIEQTIEEHGGGVRRR
jgi:hypothetical protein